MAVTRREFIFGSFLSSILCILFIILAISSNNWIKSIARDERTLQSTDSYFNYGLFSGQLQLNVLDTPTYNNIYITCVQDAGVCAASCKTTQEAREAEVRALAERQRPNPACTALNNIELDNPLPEPAVISLGFYISVLFLLFVLLLFSVAAAGLAILNATNNPKEPVFGIPGCLWTNVVTLILGITVMLTFGVYYKVSGLNNHLAFAYIATDVFDAIPHLGFSYWMLIGAVLCSILNIGLIQLRRYLLERDPPPPTIKVENHSDGTIFLY